MKPCDELLHYHQKMDHCDLKPTLDEEVDLLDTQFRLQLDKDNLILEALALISIQRICQNLVFQSSSVFPNISNGLRYKILNNL